MAFRRLSICLPSDPYYPSDLSLLGFERSPTGQYVRPGTQAGYFDFFHTDSDRANTVRKEAMHHAVRHEIYTELASLGIHPLHCTSGTGHLVKPPDMPAIPIYTTSPVVLRRKPRVLVIIGEHTQDPCVWSWRSVLTSGGLSAGTAIGLVHKLHAWGADIAADNACYSMCGLQNALTRWERDGREAPGLVVLNPGQLCWSNLEGRAMTLASWLARRREGGSAIGDPFPVDPIWNRVPGHENPEAHVKTVTEQILPNLLREDVEIYAVGIGDGGEVLVGCLERDLRGFCGGRGVKAVALMQSSHCAENVKCEDLKIFLRRWGRSWVVAPGVEKGAVVGVPDGWFGSWTRSMGLEVRRKQEESLTTPPPPPLTRQDDCTEGVQTAASTLLNNMKIEDGTFVAAAAVSPTQENIPQVENKTLNAAAATAQMPDHLGIEDVLVSTQASSRKELEEEEEEEEDSSRTAAAPASPTLENFTHPPPQPKHPPGTDQTPPTPDSRRDRDRAGSVSSVSSPIAIPLTTTRWAHDTLSKTFRKDVGIVGRPREGGEFAALEARERERLGSEWEEDEFRLDKSEQELEDGGEVGLDVPSSLDSGAAVGGVRVGEGCRHSDGSEMAKEDDGLITRSASGSNGATEPAESFVKAWEVSGGIGKKMDKPTRQKSTGWCVDLSHSGGVVGLNANKLPSIHGEGGVFSTNANELDILGRRAQEPTSQSASNLDAWSSPCASNAENETYDSMEVSTLTYSAGADVEVDELVWVEAMDEALAFFKSVANREWG